MLIAAVISNAVGLAWLALAMDTHWQQVRGPQRPTLGAARILRTLGALALLLSLVLCFKADHASMAPLVWVMALAAGALAIAFVLAWRPRILLPLIAWMPAT